jgi:hypothetical protein
MDAGVEQILDLNDGHAGLLGLHGFDGDVHVGPSEDKGSMPAQSGGKGKRLFVGGGWGRVNAGSMKSEADEMMLD